MGDWQHSGGDSDTLPLQITNQGGFYQCTDLSCEKNLLVPVQVGVITLRLHFFVLLNKTWVQAKAHSAAVSNQHKQC